MLFNVVCRLKSELFYYYKITSALKRNMENIVIFKWHILYSKISKCKLALLSVYVSIIYYPKHTKCSTSFWANIYGKKNQHLLEKLKTDYYLQLHLRRCYLHSQYLLNEMQPNFFAFKLISFLSLLLLLLLLFAIVVVVVALSDFFVWKKRGKTN